MVTTILGIISILLGFIFFMGVYYTVVEKGNKKLAWILGVLGIVFLTITPVTLAVFWASINR